jgi:breast cancer 2 susceptibility protein
MSQGRCSLFALRTKLNSLILADSSPLRKKQRMSSPIYPGFLEDLSPEDLQSLSEIDAAVSQSNYPVAPLRPSQPAQIHAEGLQTSQSTGNKRRSSELGLGVNSNPVTTQVASTSTQPTSVGGMQPGPLEPTAVGFTSVRAMAGNMPKDDYRSPSPEEPPPEQDYESWFNTPTTDVSALAGFQSASTANGTGFIGFISVGKGTSVQPSEKVLQSVKKRMRAWEVDTEEELSYILPPTPQTEVPSPPRPVTPTKPPLDSGKDSTPTIPASQQISPQHASFTRSAKQKPFKPPLLSNKTNLTNQVSASPSNAAQPKGSAPQFKPPLLSSTPTPALPKPSTPSKAISDSTFRTPVRLGGTHRPGSTTKKFTTPFKPGMRPGEPGRAKLQEDQEERRLPEPQKNQVFQVQTSSPPRKPVYDTPLSLKSPSGSRKGKEKAKEYRFFDLSQSDLGSLIPALMVKPNFRVATEPKNTRRMWKSTPVVFRG